MEKISQSRLQIGIIFDGFPDQVRRLGYFGLHTFQPTTIQFLQLVFELDFI